MPAKPPPWTIDGIDPETIAKAERLAAEAGLTLGQWLGRVIAEASGETDPESDPRTRTE